jgi:hypothetical protein
MRTAIAFLVILGGLWAVGIWAVLGSGIEFQPSENHPEHGAMYVRGSGIANDSALFNAGMGAGLLLIALFFAFFALGAGKSLRKTGVLALLGAGWLLSTSAFVAMMMAFSKYAETSPTQVAGPFTTPGNWMIFGVWGAPLVVLVAYVVGFRHWVYTDEERARFENLIAAAKAEK